MSRHFLWLSHCHDICQICVCYCDGEAFQERSYVQWVQSAALFYLKGDGTEKDLEKAKIWMAKADSQGIPEAKQALQLITLNRNLEMIGEKWFSLGEDSKK